jgi:hypothetical protein
MQAASEAFSDSEKNNLGRLVCGNHSGLGEVGESLKMMESSIFDSTARLCKLVVGSDDELIAFGPFLSRKMLEASMTSFVARADPIRILVLRKCQIHEDYSPDTRQAVSIQWTGDVIAEKKSNPADLWSPSQRATEVIRAILSGHMGELLWSTGIERATDSSEAFLGVNSDWWGEIVSKEPTKLCSHFRGQATQTYSRLSKGVHVEFVHFSAQYDVETVRSMVLETVKLIAQMALILQFVPHVFGSLPVKTAVALFLSVEKEFEK